MTWVQIVYAYRCTTASYTNLDNEFLHNIGGINGKTFYKLLNPEIGGENDDTFPTIIKHSSYYDLGSSHQHYKRVKINVQSIYANINE